MLAWMLENAWAIALYCRRLWLVEIVFAFHEAMMNVQEFGSGGWSPQ